jgi:hypothetical protein
MAVFWVVAPWCRVVRDRPGDGGSKDLGNVGKLLSDYTALQSRRQPSSNLLFSNKMSSEVSYKPSAHDII